MTLVSLLVFLLVVFILYVLIKYLLPQPMHQIALAILGVAAIIYVVVRLWPALGNFRVGG